jgi:hypothetical protein
MLNATRVRPGNFDYLTFLSDAVGDNKPSCLFFGIKKGATSNHRPVFGPKVFEISLILSEPINSD